MGWWGTSVVDVRGECLCVWSGWVMGVAWYMGWKRVWEETVRCMVWCGVGDWVGW